MRLHSINEDGGWFYLALALCVSAILWYTVNAREQIERMVEVRLDYKGLRPGLVVLSGQINTIQVRLRGPRELFRTMESRDLSHMVDLAGVDKGLNVLPLDRGDNHGFRMYQILETLPPRLTLDVDAVGGKEVPVAMRVRNPDALDSGVTVNWRGVSPGTVALKGPESVLAGIRTLIVDAPVNAYREDDAQNVQAPVLTPANVAATPDTVTAEYVVTVKRRSVTMLRQIVMEGRAEQCAAHPARVRLRVSVPEHRTAEDGYLEQVQAVINVTDLEEHTASELPIQIQLPEGARLENIAPAMTMVRCE